MKPLKVTFLDEVFEFFSVENENKISVFLKQRPENAKIFLYPSLIADFSLKSFEKGAKQANEYYTSALIATAFLILKRGLPLSDVLFETPIGNIEVFCTDTGWFNLKIPKCKQLLTKTSELRGCDVQWTDLDFGCVIRAVHTDDTASFIKDSLSEFSVLDNRVPSAVILSSSENGNITVNYCTHFSKNPPSRLLLYSASAYNEYLHSGRKASFLKSESENIALSADVFSVTVFAKPRFL